MALDWLRVETDIVGTPAPTFNATISLVGHTVPDTTSLTMLPSGRPVY
jgi:hypothetical protein